MSPSKRLLTRASYGLVSLGLILALTASAFAQEGGGRTAGPLAPDTTSGLSLASTIEGSKAPPAEGGSGPDVQPHAADGGPGLVSVIVKLKDDALAAYDGGLPGLPATSPAVTGADRLDPNAAASQMYLTYLAEQQSAFEASAKTKVPAAQITHRFNVVFGGVAMLVPAEQLGQIANLPGVVAVYPDELLQLDTEESPKFIGAQTTWNRLGGQEHAGEGVIVGILDTGIWPEHPSFSDPDPFGQAYAAPPVVPGSNGFGSGGPRSTCSFGNTAVNPNDAPFTCNNKLIGAYSFLDTYRLVIGLLPTEFDSARDDNGHGTHTASTAAGNGDVAASIFGIDRGLTSGIAPRAHVTMYRVCADEGCFTSDSVRAVQQAILDGVNVINFSISGGNNPYSDAVELAFLDAYAAGVFVAASAGNSGPTPDTVAHRGPWVTTVAASTTKRHFISTVHLQANSGASEDDGADDDQAENEEAGPDDDPDDDREDDDREDDGATLELFGASVTPGISTPTPVIFPPAGQELCLTPFAPGTFSGQIVICQRGAIARVAKSFNVAAGGAGGMLLYNPTLQGLATDNHFLPSVHLENDAGAALLAFMSSHTDVTATFTEGTATHVKGDVLAAFSSRGGPGQTLGISKPDVTAPGVQILAGHTPLPATVTGGLPGELFQAIQGTSMSSPHVAGAAALLKDLYPSWTPGQIKSALMMTARHKVWKEDGVARADPFDVGSGRINLRDAWDPGLTISASAADFVTHQNQLWHANYPSLYVPVMPGLVTVQRTAHNELDMHNTWRLRVKSPKDLKIIVPENIHLAPYGDATFDITVDARNVPLGEVRHATLSMTDGHCTLRFPITIVRRQPVVTLDKACDPAAFPQGDTTTCTITIQNTSFNAANVSLTDQLPHRLELVPGSVTGATEAGNGLVFSGTLGGAQPPLVNVAINPLASPAGYLPLAAFPGTIVVSASDENIVNFNVPQFVYAGALYSQIGIVSNGYLVVGGGTGADVQSINTNLPNPAAPNNVLAPFWTNLNPGAGGRVLIQALSDGTNAWIVVEWEAVPNFGDGLPNTFQVWIRYTGGVEDISFTYGPSVTAGDGGLLTVGAENAFGNSGGTVYFNRVGTPPTPSNTTGYEVDVFSTPGSPGQTHVITFQATGTKTGRWTNYAEMTGDIFFGTNIARFSGEVTKPPHKP